MNLHERRQARGLELGDAASACDVAGLGTDEQFDYALDVSGALPGITDVLGRLRKRGTFIQMGVALTVPLLPYCPYDLYEKEWRILGSNSVAGCYPLAAQNMLTIVDDMRSLITHRVSLEDFDEAVSAKASPDAIKVHLQPNQGHAQ
jgi:threonine dehydrogenase-like Zn-dependent dehydrogenase